MAPTGGPGGAARERDAARAGSLACGTGPSVRERKRGGPVGSGRRGAGLLGWSGGVGPGHEGSGPGDRGRSGPRESRLGLG